MKQNTLTIQHPSILPRHNPRLALGKIITRDEMNKRFDETNKRFNKMNKRFDKHFKIKHK